MKKPKPGVAVAGFRGFLVWTGTMVTENLPMGQGLPAGAKGAEGCLFVGLTDDEIVEFLREPSARFVTRERELRDTPLYSWQSACPPFCRGARRLVVVFRSGHQIAVDEPPGFLVLARAIRLARRLLKRCPALGADATPDTSPCFFLKQSRVERLQDRLADKPVPPVLAEFMYVDAPGNFSIGIYGVRLYKQFDSRDLSIVDRYTLGAFQAMIDRQRRFDRKRLRGYTGPLVYPRKLLLQSRSRRR